MPKILLVEDDLEIAEAIADILQLYGHTLEWVETRDEGQEHLKHGFYELAILDWMLGDESGLELCNSYRLSGGKLPILMLSARGELTDRVAGLEAGADDYLTKPFALSELVARVTALLRRPAESYVTLKLGDLELDSAGGVVIRNGEQIQLRSNEMSVLEFLIRHPQQTFSSRQLLERVWRSDSNSTEAAVRKTITRIREKLDFGGRSYILSFKNIGYRISVMH